MVPTDDSILDRQSEFVALQFLNAVTDAFIIVDSEWTIRYVNAEAARLACAPVNSLVGRNHWQIWPFLKGTRIEEEYRRAVREESPIHLKYYFGDSKLWLDIRAFPRTAAEGGGLHIVFRDVSREVFDQERLRLLEGVVVHANDSVLITEACPIDAPKLRVLYVNEAFTRMTGYTAQEVAGVVPSFLEGSDTDSDTREFIRLKLRSWEAFRVEVLHYRKDGTPFWVEINAHPILSPSLSLESCSVGKLQMHWVAVQREVTERREREEQLRRSEECLQRLVATSPDCIKSLDLNGIILSINESGDCAMEMEPCESLAGRQWVDYLSGEMRTRTDHALDAARHGATTRFQGFCATSKGTPKYWDAVVAPLLGPDGLPEQILAIVRDITHIKALEAEQNRLLAEANERAQRDPLTGLYNHRSFHEMLEQVAGRAARTDESLAVIVLDVNNFKSFNDAFGHLEGDKILRQLSEAIKLSCAAVPPGTIRECVAARVGGDEFAVFLFPATRAIADALAKSLMVALDGMGYVPPDKADCDISIPLEMSAGIAMLPEDAETAAHAFLLADEQALRNKAGTGVYESDTVRRQFREESAGFAVLDDLVTAIDDKDRYQRKHSDDVYWYSLRIAEALSMPEAERRTLAVAAFLHGIGKVGVPDRILRHPGVFTGEELRAVRRHPAMGAAMIRGVPSLAGAAPAVHYHHERWDGTGFSSGLTGNSIPLAARIIAVADAFSSLTTDRPFRKRVSAALALGILSSEAGSRWDPEIVDAFSGSFRRANEAR